MKTLNEWTIAELEDEVASLAARIAAASGRLLELLAELDRRGAVEEGFVSLAHWLSWRTGLRLPAAREHVRAARALRQLPATAAALQQGEISYSKARAITRVATPESESRLLEMAKDGSAAQLERIVRGVRAVGLAEAERATRIEHRRELTCFYDDDGMLVIRGRLAPEEGALLLRALEAARDEGAPDRAAQLARVAERSLAGGDARRGDSTRVVVHVDATVLADPAQEGRNQLDDGPGVSAETSRRLACDAALRRMCRTSAGEAEGGARTRVVSAPLRRAMSARDGGHCGFPGCSNRIVDAHHIRHWVDGGETRLANLVSLCRRHHVLVHEQGYRIEVGADALQFFKPDGRKLEVAPRPPPTRDPLPLRHPDPWILSPTWCRENGIDYHEAVRAGLPTAASQRS